MGLLVALALAQLLPGQPVPSCHWREVAVWCQRGCSCSEVEVRLELARAELVAHWSQAPADFDARLAGWRLFVADKPFLLGPVGEFLYGVTVLEERRVVLTRDMRGALHELVHVLEPHPPRRTPHEHPSWDADGALREIDARYQLRFRGRQP